MHLLITLVARYHKLLTASLLFAITALSLWPVTHLPSVPGTDKTHHFIAYGALIFPLALYFLTNQIASPLTTLKKMITTWLILVLYSGLIELIQPYVNRYGEWLDLAANSLGLLCGIVIAKVLAIYFNTLNNKLIKN